MKKLLSAVIATGSILALAGCGSASSGSGTTDTKADKGMEVIGQNVQYDPNHLVNDGKPIEIQYWSWGDKNTDPAFQMIDEYEKIYPNVTIKTQNVVWDDYWTKLPLTLKGSNGPALFNIHNSQDALLRPYLANYDIPVKDLEADFLNVNVHENDGKVAYIDSVINTGNIYYNKTLWAEAGLTDQDIPKTWDDFVKVAQKLTKSDGGKITQAGFNMNGDATYDAIWQGLNYQKGVLQFDKDGKTPNFDNSTTVENMQFLKDLYDKYNVGSTSFGTDASQSFGNGQSAMVYRWGWMEGTLKDKYPDIDYGVFPTPTPSSDTPFAYDRYNGESTMGINKNQSKEQQEVAQDFVKFCLANDDFVRRAAAVYNSFPAKKSLANDEKILENPVAAAIGPRVDRLIWAGPAPATMETSAKQAYQNVFLNKKPIDSSIADAQAQMEKDMKNSDFTSAESKYSHYDEAAKQ
jgi:multiple sugar transport system substrate-binding protein